jgi:hypothetical protein
VVNAAPGRALRALLLSIPFPVVIAAALSLGQPGWTGRPRAAGGFDEERAARITRGLLRAAPRRGPDGPGRAAAAAWVAKALREAGATQVRFRVFESGGRVWQNVEAELPAQPAPGERPAAGAILIGAHLDAVAGSPGALDNAAGVGVILEAVGQLTSMPHRRRIEVRIWDGEEAGLLGSATEAHARAAAGPALPAAVLVVDVVGTEHGSLVMHSLPGTWLVRATAPTDAWLPRTVISAAAAAGVEVSQGDDLLTFPYQFIVRACRLPFASDDGPFLEQGVPSLFLTDFSFSAPYAHYHRPSDDASRIHAPALGRAGRALLSAVVALDGAETIPPQRGEPHLFLGGRAIHGAWLHWALLAAALPLLGLLLGPRRSMAGAVLLAGYAVACIDGAVPAAQLLALPVWGAPAILRLRGRRRMAVAALSWLPGAYCGLVLLWALARFGTLMPVLLPPFLASGLLAAAPAWLLLVTRRPGQPAPGRPDERPHPPGDSPAPR